MFSFSFGQNKKYGPEDALANLTGEHFLYWLFEYVSDMVKTWPEFVIKDKTVKEERLKKFLLQRFLVSKSFWGKKEQDPGLLSFALSNLSECPDPLAENTLEFLEKMKQADSTQGDKPGGISSHEKLWSRLFSALGITESEVAAMEPKDITRSYISELSDYYMTAEWQSVIGAIIAHEHMRPIEFLVLEELTKKNVQLNKDALELFHVPVNADEKWLAASSHALEKVMMDPESRRLVLDGAARQASVMHDWYSVMVRYLSS